MKVIIITGGSRGIGAALAKEFIFDKAESWRIALIATSVENLSRVKSEIEHLDPQIDIEDRLLCLGCDVASNEQVVQAVKTVFEKWGRIDVAVANAGVTLPSSGRTSVIENLQKIFGINFFGAVHLFDAVLPHMKAARSGYLASVSSLASFDSMAPFHGYCATKAALNRWVEGLDQELRPQQIRVTNFCPGFVRTDMIKGQKLPMPFLLEAADAARIIHREIKRDRSGLIRFPIPMSIAVYLLQFIPYRWVNDFKVKLAKRMT